LVKKKGGVNGSELLLAAARRRTLLRAADRYVADLIAEVGQPSARERARAAAVSERIIQRRVRTG
jgi:hypothetical protein